MVEIRSPASSSYYDARLGLQVVTVHPCEFYITDRQDEMLAIILGSCVAACMRDPVAGVAGANHFMLPSTERSLAEPLSDSLRYGNHAMDLLIDGLVSRGAKRERLETKVFGGGNVTAGPSVGERNAEWVMEYLRRRRLPVAASHLGGAVSRRLHYYPATGVVLMRQIGTGHMPAAADSANP